MMEINSKKLENRETREARKRKHVDCDEVKEGNQLPGSFRYIAWMIKFSKSFRLHLLMFDKRAHGFSANGLAISNLLIKVWS